MQGYVIAPWLFNLYLGWMVSGRMYRRSLELNERFAKCELHQPLFAEDSREKLCHLVTDFRRLRMNV